jgi:hypothetical protein
LITACNVRLGSRSERREPSAKPSLINVRKTLKPSSWSWLSSVRRRSAGQSHAYIASNCAMKRILAWLFESSSAMY